MHALIDPFLSSSLNRHGVINKSLFLLVSSFHCPQSRVAVVKVLFAASRRLSRSPLPLISSITSFTLQFRQVTCPGILFVVHQLDDLLHSVRR